MGRWKDVKRDLAIAVICLYLDWGKLESVNFKNTQPVENKI